MQQKDDTTLYTLFKSGKYVYNLKIKDLNNNNSNNTNTNTIKLLYFSLLKTNILTNVSYNSEDNLISFTASTVETLEDYLCRKVVTEALTIKMIDTLTQQIKYLETHNYIHYGHNIDDILVIDDTTFININVNTLLPIKDEVITFLIPFEKPYFVSPSIKQITFLPTKVSFEETYYSLASLVIYFLLGNILELDNTDIRNKTNQDKIEHILKPIFYTKLYWFLKRCLNQKKLLLI